MVNLDSKLLKELYEAYSVALDFSPSLDDTRTADLDVGAAVDKLHINRDASSELLDVVSNATAAWSYQGFIWGYGYCLKVLAEKGILCI